MKQETQDAATLVWEWESAPLQLRNWSPAYDDVSYLVVLPKGQTDVPDWVASLVFPGGGGDEWKTTIRTGELSGRVLVAVCHA